MRGLELHHYMDGGEFVGEATTRGVLLRLGKYPGLVDGDGTVRGELYRFHDLAAALDVLDDIEGYEPTDPTASQYLRVQKPVATASGGEARAWVYVYNGQLGDGRRIGGDWRAEVRAPTDRA